MIAINIYFSNIYIFINKKQEKRSLTIDGKFMYNLQYYIYFYIILFFNLFYLFPISHVL